LQLHSLVGICINVIFIYQTKRTFQCRLLSLYGGAVISHLNFHLFSIESKDKLRGPLTNYTDYFGANIRAVQSELWRIDELMMLP
jgi:hypothetical protein